MKKREREPEKTPVLSGRAALPGDVRVGECVVLEKWGGTWSQGML